jgi:hypothetical protein
MANGNAVAAVEASLAILEALRSKTEEVIAFKLANRRSVAKDRAERATLNRQIANARDFLLEVKAASVVVTAPTPEEIAETQAVLRRIRELAVEDAIVAGGIELIRQGLVTAKSLRDGVEVEE